MWKQPWSFKEGTAISCGLLLVGVMLQLSMGQVRWELFAFPVNVAVLGLLLLLIVVMHLLRRKVYLLRFMTTTEAAVPALIAASLMTVVMGLVRQVPETQQARDALGFTYMLRSWPFVLIYFYATLILGLVSLRFVLRRRFDMSLFHLGLFLVLVCGTLGSADMRRYTMNISGEMPEWRATDAWGNIHELPIAIQLDSFTIDAYPPKIFVANKYTGKAVGGKTPQSLTIDSDFKSGSIGRWNVKALQKLDAAAPVITTDSATETTATTYEPWNGYGSVPAVLVSVSGQGMKEKTGWLSCGNFMLPMQFIDLGDSLSLVMGEPEPERFLSRVNIITKSGKNAVADIEVNKPYSIDGWKIYQLNYDTTRGKWSRMSVLELVRDPWLPAVYAGLFMLVAGALWMFIARSRTKNS